MARATKSTDLRELPGLERLAEEVRATGEPHLLTRDGEEIAVVVPVRRNRRKPTHTEADLRAFQSAAGAWRGLIDVDRFIDDNYQTRARSSRPPVSL
jgi:hypothetical protein